MNEFNNNSNNNEKKFKITDLITNKQYNAILNLVLGYSLLKSYQRRICSLLFDSIINPFLRSKSNSF